MPFSPFDFNPYFWTRWFVAVALAALAIGAFFKAPGTRRKAFEKFPYLFSVLVFWVGAISVIASVTFLTTLGAGGSTFFSDAKDSWAMNLFFAYMAVAASEEGVKMVAALAMFAVAESWFREKVSETPERFVAYAFAWAVAFALFENAAYFASQPPTVFSDWTVAYESSKATVLAFSRTAFSIPAHVLFSLLAAYWAVKAVETGKVRHAIGFFAAAACLHAFLNVVVTFELQAVALVFVILPAWLATYFHVESELVKKEFA